MPSLDIVSEIDMQEIDNTVNNAKKVLSTRFDFKNVQADVELDKKEKKIVLRGPDRAKMESMRDVLIGEAAKRKIDPKAFEYGDIEDALGGTVKREIKIREGLDQPLAKDIVKRIKESKLKVQAAIQGELVRVSGKKIDDLREVMALVREADLPIPIQFTNMRS